MASQDGHLYRTPGGIVSVTNPVHRMILNELAHGERQLQDLVEVTGKAKSALSGVYMKDLLRQGLVVERPHPKDNRRKVFRLQAVPEHGGAPGRDARGSEASGQSFDAAAVLRTIAAAPDDAPVEMLQAQARALGAHVTAPMRTDSVQAFATSFARYVEDEGLAVHLQLDFEAPSFRCQPGEGLLGAVSPVRVGLLLAALAEGVAEANGLRGVKLVAERDGEAFRIATG